VPHLLPRLALAGQIAGVVAQLVEVENMSGVINDPISDMLTRIRNGSMRGT
jgi:hypothetical protein